MYVLIEQYRCQQENKWHDPDEAAHLLRGVGTDCLEELPEGMCGALKTTEWCDNKYYRQMIFIHFV